MVHVHCYRFYFRWHSTQFEWWMHIIPQIKIMKLLIWIGNKWKKIFLLVFLNVLTLWEEFKPFMAIKCSNKLCKCPISKTTYYFLMVITCPSIKNNRSKHILKYSVPCIISSLMCPLFHPLFFCFSILGMSSFFQIAHK